MTRSDIQARCCDCSTLPPFSSCSLFDVIPSLPFILTSTTPPQLHLHLLHFTLVWFFGLLAFSHLSDCSSLQGNTIESEHLSELTEEEYEAQIFHRQDLKGFMWLDAKYLNPFFTRRLTQEVKGILSVLCGLYFCIIIYSCAYQCCASQDLLRGRIQMKSLTNKWYEEVRQGPSGSEDDEDEIEHLWTLSVLMKVKMSRWSLVWATWGEWQGNLCHITRGNSTSHHAFKACRPG